MRTSLIIVETDTSGINRSTEVLGVAVVIAGKGVALYCQRDMVTIAIVAFARDKASCDIGHASTNISLHY